MKALKEEHGEMGVKAWQVTRGGSSERAGARKINVAGNHDADSL